MSVYRLVVHFAKADVGAGWGVADAYCDGGCVRGALFRLPGLLVDGFQRAGLQVLDAVSSTVVTEKAVGLVDCNMAFDVTARALLEADQCGVKLLVQFGGVDASIFVHAFVS